VNIQFKHLATEGFRLLKRSQRVFRRKRTGAAVGDIQRYRDGLAVQRAALDSQLAALEQALAVLGAGTPVRKAPPSKERGGAGYRSGSLKAHIQTVLQVHGGAMAVKNVTAAVRKAGFATKNRTLDKSVGIALAGMPSVTKIRRGVFRAK